MWSVTSPTISIVIPPSLSFSALRRLGYTLPDDIPHVRVVAAQHTAQHF